MRACEKFADCDPSTVARWIGAIPFEEWPQQHRLEDGKIRPAMVTNLAWRGFGIETESLVEELVRKFEGQASRRMLSVVMPGASIEPHADPQDERFITRVHVPLVTNPEAVFVIEGVAYHLEVGSAYRVNINALHSVHNDGLTPRIHLMFDVRKV